MKKLGILVMAMVLVCGMSLGVMADDAGDPADDEVSDSVDVELTVDGYAAINFGDDINLDLDKPQTDGEWEDGEGLAQGSTNFDVQTNTDVNIELSETMTSTLIDAVGEDKVWPVVDDDWITTSSMWVMSDERDFSSGDGNYSQEFDNDEWNISFDQDAATTESYSLSVENKWNGENEWWEFEEETYDYTITATVSAD